MIHLAFLLSLFHVEMVLGDNGPPRLWHDPKRGYTVVFAKVVSLGHVLVAEVHFNVGVVGSALFDLVV